MTLEERLNNRDKKIEDDLERIINNYPKIKMIVKNFRNFKPSLTGIKDSLKAKVDAYYAEKIIRTLEKSEEKIVRLETKMQNNERKFDELSDKIDKKEQQIAAWGETFEDFNCDENSMEFQEYLEQFFTHKHRLETELFELKMETVRLEEKNNNIDFERSNLESEYPQFFTVDAINKRLRQITINQEQSSFHMPADAAIKVKMAVSQNKLVGKAFKLIKSNMSSLKGERALKNLTLEELKHRIPTDAFINMKEKEFIRDIQRRLRYEDILEEKALKDEEIAAKFNAGEISLEELVQAETLSLGDIKGQKFLADKAFESNMELIGYKKRKIEYSEYVQIRESEENIETDYDEVLETEEFVDAKVNSKSVEGVGPLAAAKAAKENLKDLPEIEISKPKIKPVPVEGVGPLAVAKAASKAKALPKENSEELTTPDKEFRGKHVITDEQLEAKLARAKHVRKEEAPITIENTTIENTTMEYDTALELYQEVIKKYGNKPEILIPELESLEVMYPDAKSFPDFMELKNQAEKQLTPLEKVQEIFPNAKKVTIDGTVVHKSR